MTKDIKRAPSGTSPSAIRVRTRPVPALPQTPTPTKPASAENPRYEVGYGRPPKHTRFRPGQSGNPQGRPKGAHGLVPLLRKELQSKVTLRENGATFTVTKLEAIMKRLIADTLAGKPSQMKLLFNLVQLVENKNDEPQQARSLSRADAEIVMTMIRGLPHG